MTHFAIYTGADGKKFVGNTTQGPIIEHISRMSGCSVTSNARNAEAEKLLHQIGLHSQAEVIKLHAQGVPGYGPANSVTTSTHCGYNDGVAYPKKRAGAKLSEWEYGFDLNTGKGEIADFISEARKEGLIVTTTYPGSIGEAQHCNIRKAPPAIFDYLIRPLKKGSKGPRVKTVTKMLCVINSPTTHKPYLTGPTRTITDRVSKAIKDFQKDHHQTADGVVGMNTRRQLQSSYAYHKKK
jgi:hypothetical protein